MKLDEGMNEQTNEHYYCMQGIKNISQLYLGNIKKTKLLTCCVYIKETSCTIDALQYSCRKKTINFIILLSFPLQKISYFLRLRHSNTPVEKETIILLSFHLLKENFLFFTTEALQYSCRKRNNNSIIFSSPENFLFFSCFHHFKY